MLQKDIELYYRSLWPTTVEFRWKKTSYNWYKLSDYNVIGSNSKRCLKTRGELNNLS